MPSTDKEREEAKSAMERQVIYEHLLNRGCTSSSTSKFDAQLVRLMEQQGVSVPDDDATLRLRQNLFNLINLGDKVEADGATVLEQAVLWLDGLLKEASLEKDGPLLNLRLEIRTQCVLTHLMPPNVLGKTSARNGKKALEKQFPKRDSGGSKGPEARETLRYKLLDKARPTAAAPAAARRRASCSPPGTARRPPAAMRPPPPAACARPLPCHAATRLPPALPPARRSRSATIRRRRTSRRPSTCTASAACSRPSRRSCRASRRRSSCPTLASTRYSRGAPTTTTSTATLPSTRSARPHQTMHTPRAPCAHAVHTRRAHAVRTPRTRHAQVCSHQTNEEA